MVAMKTTNLRKGPKISDMKTRNLSTNLVYNSNFDRVWSMPELGTLDYCRENVIRL